MEIGAAYRYYWVAILLGGLVGPPGTVAPGYLTWKYFIMAKVKIDLLHKCKADPSLAAAVIAKGADKYIEEDGINLWGVTKDFFSADGGMGTAWTKYGDSAPIVYPSPTAQGGGNLFTASQVDMLLDNDQLVKTSTARGCGGKPGTKFSYGRQAINALIKVHCNLHLANHRTHTRCMD
eukprot:SAG31_NODE_1174_length_9538_cov_3.152453_8_plen_178_part_00